MERKTKCPPVRVEIAGTGIGWTEHTACDKNGTPIEFRSSDNADAVALARRIAEIRARQLSFRK